MKKYFILAGLGVIAYFLIPKDEPKSQVIIPKPIRVKSLPLHLVDKSRAPSSTSQKFVIGKKEVPEAGLDLGNLKDAPERIEPAIEYALIPGLPSGYGLAQNTGLSTPQAIKISKGTLHPISPVIVLTDVTEAQRSDLKARGYAEYSYQKDMKTLFVEASPETVIAAHKELADLGYKSHLEVQRHFNRPR
jgi:hypothetical protein